VGHHHRHPVRRHRHPVWTLDIPQNRGGMHYEE
jgi:hypothetical protein